MGREKGDGNDLVQGAISEGIEAILQRHPRFRGMQQAVTQHVDPQRLKNGLRGIEQYIIQLESKRGKEFSDQERAQMLYNGVVNYVASGGAFDDDGKEIILRKSLEERAKKGPRSWEAQRELKGEQYLEKVTVAFRELYDRFKQGDYVQHMPEVAKAVTTVYNMGFLGPALDLMKQYGLIDRKRYALIKKNIIKRTERAVEETTQKMEEYSSGEQPNYGSAGHGRAVAAGLGLAGLGVMLFSGTRATGGVIGGSFSELLLPFSGVLLLVASWLLLGKVRRSMSAGSFK
ncbi:hypothetical protein FJZ18_03610 [Candidatus Pacearchaeota archaeon]|nr:hypothetical protein [Candidatus Pacearchaeota archaeon]